MVGSGDNFEDTFKRCPTSRGAYFHAKAATSQATFLTYLAKLQRELGIEIDANQNLSLLDLEALLSPQVAAA